MKCPAASDIDPPGGLCSGGRVSAPLRERTDLVHLRHDAITVGAPQKIASVSVTPQGNVRLGRWYRGVR